MAEMTAIPYWTIAKCAALSAVLYYVGVFAMVHLEAVKIGLQPMDSSDLPPLSSVLPRSYLLLPFFSWYTSSSRGTPLPCPACWLSS